MGIYPKGTQRKYLLVFLKALQNGIMMRIRLINQHFPSVRRPRGKLLDYTDGGGIDNGGSEIF